MQCPYSKVQTAGSIVDTALALRSLSSSLNEDFRASIHIGDCLLMFTNCGATESSSDAIVSTKLPSNSDVALSNEVKVAVGDDLLESNTGTLTTEPSSGHDGGGTVVDDSVNGARVSGDEIGIVVDNVDKVLDEKEKEVNDEEKEGEYKVSDLVWAKVRNFPWWPGQIFDRSASTDVARKHSNKKGFLIAYFGDQTFAWNEKSKIKPFRKNFSKMEKQSNSNKFLHAVDCALDEALRRVEFGLSCSCLSEEVYDIIKSQTFDNAGIKKECSTINGGDNFSSVANFKPANVVQSVQDLAREHFDGYNRLQVLSLHTQLFSYYRWRGYHQFSTRYFLYGDDEKLEDNSEVPLIAKSDSVDENVSSKKRKIENNSKLPLMKKDKKMVAVSENVSKKRKSNDSDSVNSQKHKHMINGDNRDMIPKKKERFLTKDSGKNRNGIAIPSPKILFGVGHSICKIAKQLSVSPLIPKTESQFQSQVTNNSVDEKHVDQIKESTNSVTSDSSVKTSKEQLTALILKFTNLDSIPSVTELNEIFRKYGSVRESETEVLRKSNCAKVVFEEKSNAETAFSSAGKFSIFGPSLISYKLDYSPTPRKIYTRKGKKKNGNAVGVIKFDD